MIYANDKQSVKESFSILVTEVGIMIFVYNEHSLKAESPISVTEKASAFKKEIIARFY